MNRKTQMKGLLLGAMLGTATLFSTVAQAAGPWEYSTDRTAEGNISLAFTDLNIVLPADWSGKVRMSANSESHALSICHAASRDKWTEQLGFANGGVLFTIYCSPDFEYTDIPDSYYLGEGTYGSYIFATPSDVQSYYEDAAIANEYRTLFDQTDWIRDHITINGSNSQVIATSEDYILPHSSEVLLSEADLAGMNYDRVQMAINEIYARHHRRFQLKEVQAYFDARSWYEGTINAADFNPASLSQLETTNIDLMVKQLSKLDPGTLSPSGGQPSQSSPQQAAPVSSHTKSGSGSIIQTGADNFRVLFDNGDSIQFWYDAAKVSGANVYMDAKVNVTYDVDTYEALSLSLR